MSDTSSTTATSFEAALSELEHLIAAMESGELPLEESLAHYQRGIALLRQCRNTLEAAEQRIQVLEGEQLQDLATKDEAP